MNAHASRLTVSATRVATIAALLLLSVAKNASAQGADLDDRLVALTYHKVSGKPLDLQAAAERSDAARRATNFDRPDVAKAEAARLAGELAAADGRHEFVVSVGDNVSEYDHARGEFTVPLFSPGFYVQSQAFGQDYRIVFDNAESARAIAMAKEQARELDARLARNGRGVVDEIHFRIVGDGDPAGAVTGERVVRATIVSARVLDRTGALLYAPAIAAAPAKPAEPTPAKLDLSRADVAGLRVGGKAKDLEPTLARLFGPVSRVGRGKDWYAGYAAALEVNSMGCFSLPGRRNGGEPGNVCVTAYLDGDDVVRAVRIERVFPFVNQESFRATLVRRYGPVAEASDAGSYSLGWGPPVDGKAANTSSGPHTALTARYDIDDDMMRSALNAAPRVRVTLQLVDAGWTAAKK